MTQKTKIVAKCLYAKCFSQVACDHAMWKSFEAFGYVKYESKKVWYDFELHMSSSDQNRNF